MKRVAASATPVATPNVDMQIKSQKTKYVIKFSGEKQKFSTDKIANSIWMAAQNVGGKDIELACVLCKKLL